MNDEIGMWKVVWVCLKVPKRKQFNLKSANGLFQTDNRVQEGPIFCVCG